MSAPLLRDDRGWRARTFTQWDAGLGEEGEAVQQLSYQLETGQISGNSCRRPTEKNKWEAGDFRRNSFCLDTFAYF